MISRHKITRNVNDELFFFKDNFEKTQKRLIKRINKNMPFNLWAYKRTGLDLSTFILSADDINNVDFNIGLNYYLELGIRHMEREFSDDALLSIKIGKDQYKIDSSKKNIGKNLFDWWNLLNISMIQRNDVFKQELLELVELCQEETKDPFWKKSTELILMCQKKKKFKDSILLEIKEVVDSGFVEYFGLNSKGLVKSSEGIALIKRLWLPLMELYYNALKGNQLNFNKILEKFILDKKSWIIDQNENDNSGYWIDYFLLACCSFAFDNNISITVQSEYIPLSIYNGGQLNIS